MYIFFLFILLWEWFNQATMYFRFGGNWKRWLSVSVYYTCNVKCYIALVTTYQRYYLVPRRRFSRPIWICRRNKFFTLFISSSRKMNYISFRDKHKNVILVVQILPLKCQWYIYWLPCVSTKKWNGMKQSPIKTMNIFFRVKKNITKRWKIPKQTICQVSSSSLLKICWHITKQSMYTYNFSTRVSRKIYLPRISWTTKLRKTNDSILKSVRIRHYVISNVHFNVKIII